MLKSPTTILIETLRKQFPTCSPHSINHLNFEQTPPGFTDANFTASTLNGLFDWISKYHSPGLAIGSIAAFGVRFQLLMNYFSFTKNNGNREGSLEPHFSY